MGVERGRWHEAGPCETLHGILLAELQAADALDWTRACARVRGRSRAGSSPAKWCLTGFLASSRKRLEQTRKGAYR